MKLPHDLMHPMREEPPVEGCSDHAGSFTHLWCTEGARGPWEQKGESGGGRPWQAIASSALRRGREDGPADRRSPTATDEYIETGRGRRSGGDETGKAEPICGAGGAPWSISLLPRV